MVQRVYEEPEFSEVLDRVPLEVRQSLTFEQRSAISQALKESRRKQLYFVMFIGKDRRLAIEEKMLDRRTSAGRWGLAILLGIGAVGMTIFLVVGAYIAKSKAGIDLMPNAHASDLLKGFGGQ